MDIELMSEASVRYYYCMNTQLKDHIYKRAQNYFDAAKKTRSEIYVKEQLEEYNRKQREKFINGIGGIAWDRAPLDAKITSVKEYEHYNIENIIFCSRKDTYVTGSMYIPHGLTKPTGAVLFLHGHSADTRHYPAYQSACDTLARAGLIVFAIDPVGQGERVSYFDSEKNEYIIPPCTDDHDCAGVPAVATGKFIQRYFLSDEMRAVDYMLTRPEIDPKKIGVTGNSGGGTQTMAMMAADDRIAAAAPATFVTSREAYMYSGEPQDSEQIWYGITEAGYDHINPIMNFAPKPLAILTVNYDFFALEGTRDTVIEAQRFYDMYGKRENLYWFRDDALHEYTPYLQRCAAKFFAKHLLGKDVEIDNSLYEMKPIEVFYNTKSGRVRGEIEGARFLYDENNDVARNQFDERHSLPGAARLIEAEAWLREKVYANRIPYDFFIRKLETYKTEKYITAPIFWHSQKDLFNFAFLIRATENESKRLPVIVAVWEDGTKKIAEHEEWIAQKCSEGYEVMVLDVSGVGYIQADKINAHDIKAKYGTMYKLCSDLLYMGDSMTALRSYDVLRAVDMLHEVYGLEYGEITIYCESKYGVYGMIAAFLNRETGVIYGDDLLENVFEQEIKPFAKAYYDDLAVLMPGMLKYFDYDELKR